MHHAFAETCTATTPCCSRKNRRFAAFVKLQAQNTPLLCTVRNKHMPPTHKKLRPPPVQTHTKPILSSAAKGAAVQRIGGLLPHVIRSPAAYVLHVRTPHPQIHTKPRLSAAAKGTAVQRMGGLRQHVLRSPAAYVLHVLHVLHVRTPHLQTHTEPRLSAAAKGTAVQRKGGLLQHVMRSPAAYA